MSRPDVAARADDADRPPAESPPPSGEADRRRRALKTSAADMVRSMAVILAVVALIYLLVPRPQTVERPEVDVAGAASAAADRLAFEPAVPADLPEGWVPTGAGVQRGSDGIRTWAIVYRTPDGGFAGLRQAADATDHWEDTQVGDAPEEGTRPVDGVDWVVRHEEGQGLHSLVHRADTVTTIVLTRGTDEDVATLASALSIGRSLVRS